MAKFSQHQDLIDALLATDDTTLIEGSKNKIWGVGLAIHDPKIWDPKNWTGRNLMGKLLERVRSELR